MTKVARSDVHPGRTPSAVPEGARPASTGRLAIEDLRKRFGANQIFDGFDVTFSLGRVTSIFGPNGCGKSTLLNMAAGLLKPDGGAIRFETGDPEAPVPRTGYVFQNYREALFPWRSAYQNICYPLKVAGWSKAARRERVDEMAELFGIRFDLHRYPYLMSGGQQQITAVMRSLATNPEVLFLDEPFSALDYEMTLSLRDTLQAVQHATGVTMILVSHDLDEAVYLSDEILLLTKAPTGLAERLHFDAPRPRGSGTMSSPDFVAVKAEALEIFRREVHR
ncbi:ABC transporter ATP-binding protein [Actinomadura sp. WMMB 499]|uniref:ABC transporter ATP-binding protein n=1 Tax=Actinomadura sp. WMMB 499 TaxID=1219491 RepID=UPI00124608A1|nr:ABC transporter ATP-binding protein [Actinomadura sp. WMMB 499]QFG22583.1 ABC transporter ATP-binding protein [Actinomadura sp. WMMB 499]